MSKFGLLTQVAMILIAVAIGILYIKPTVTSIRETEDSISLYEHEVDNVSAVNQNLAAKIMTIDAIPAADSQALLRYLPDSVDEIAVMKDIVAILAKNSISSPDVVAKKGALATPVEGESVQPAVVPYDFEVKFKASYPQLLTTLTDFEVNDYLLQVSDLKINPDVTTGELDVLVTLSAYSLAPLTGPETEVIVE